MIEVQNITFEYTQKKGVSDEVRIRALENVSFQVTRGDFFVIVGPSGCGKTSILKLISGLMIPKEGEILVDGKRVRGPLKNVGMAFQNPILLPWRSTLENVLLPLEVVEPYRHRFSSSKKDFVKRAMELLKIVGLDGFEKSAPWELSGGMQQRASLCRALIHEPEILLLDEPFGALDAFTREELWLVLQELWLTKKCTIVLVTHDIKEAVFLAKNLLIMTARPGTVKSEMKMPFRRPRKLELCYTRTFTKFMYHVRSEIR